jgi:hypothetical protein
VDYLVGADGLTFTQALSNAHTALPTTGGKIIVREGVYSLTSNFTFTRPVLIEGMGVGATSISAAWTTSNGLFIVGVGGSVELRDLSLHANSTSGASGAMLFSSTQVPYHYAIVRRCRITGVAGHYFMSNSNAGAGRDPNSLWAIYDSYVDVSVTGNYLIYADSRQCIIDNSTVNLRRTATGNIVLMLRGSRQQITNSNLTLIGASLSGSSAIFTNNNITTAAALPFEQVAVMSNNRIRIESESSSATTGIFGIVRSHTSPANMFVHDNVISTDGNFTVTLYHSSSTNTDYKTIFSNNRLIINNTRENPHEYKYQLLIGESTSAQHVAMLNNELVIKNITTGNPFVAGFINTTTGAIQYSEFKGNSILIEPTVNMTFVKAVLTHNFSAVMFSGNKVVSIATQTGNMHGIELAQSTVTRTTINDNVFLQAGSILTLAGNAVTMASSGVTTFGTNSRAYYNFTT